VAKPELLPVQIFYQDSVVAMTAQRPVRAWYWLANAEIRPTMPLWLRP
jgi:hypothetical protein